MAGIVDRLATKRAAWVDSLPSDAPWDDMIEMCWIVRAIADELADEGPGYYNDGEGPCDCSERAADFLRKQAEL